MRPGIGWSIRVILLICWFLGLALSGRGQLPANLNIIDTGRIVSRVFDDADGLPQNTINTITIDNSGYLWVGTQEGAAYYNGNRWNVVPMPNRSVSNWVYAILKARDGSLWFATNGGGLNQLKDDHWTTYDASKGLPTNQVRAIWESQNAQGESIIWAGTEKGLACLINNSWTIYNTDNGLPNNVVRSITETISNAGQRALWVGTEGGLACLVDGKWTRYQKELPNNIVRALIPTKSASGGHAVWIGTEGGLARFDAGRWSYQNTTTGMPSNEIRCLLESQRPDGSSVLWVGTGGYGLARWQNNQWTTFDTRSGLNDNSVWSLMEQVSANGHSLLWVGMASRGGLARFEMGHWISFDTQAGLPNSVIFSFLETKSDDGHSSFWIGTDGGLGHWVNGQWQNYNSKSGLPNDVVRALLETQENQRSVIWVGTEGGLARFSDHLSDKRWQVYDTSKGLPNNKVYCLLQTKTPAGESVLWVGTRGGLACLTKGQWQIYNTDNGLPNNVIRSLAAQQTPEGKTVIWVGTEGGGLARLQDGQWKIYDMAKGLPSNMVRSLLITKDGKDRAQTLWVGTDGGVCWTNLTGDELHWQHLSDATSPAIPNNTIYQLRQDEQQRIYLFTNKGVARLTQDAVRGCCKVESFTTKDGLPSNECNGGASMIDSSGRIWAGTIAGAAVYDPQQEYIDHQPKPLYIEQLLAGGKRRALAITNAATNGTIELGALAHNENALRFEFALLSYFREVDTRYQVQLVGYEDKPSDWTTETKKEYTNIGEGEYTFKVWGQDYLGNMTGPVMIHFQIRPAPWRSWWAYGCYVLLLAGIVYSLHNFRLKRLNEQNRRLEQKVLERTDELAQKNQELSEALTEVQLAHQQTEEKNRQLDKINEELADKNLELLKSHQRADRIFSVLAEALAGTVLDDKYRLEEKIGTGGFGAVYRATQLSDKRDVAVKVFRPTPGNDSIEALERFRMEAVSAYRINHPNVVSIIDSGVSGEGIAYIAMELLRGHTLKDELKGNKIVAMRRALEVLLPVCDVLSKAHKMGIIHRDIKPDNIFLHQSDEGEIIKVVDFGIAKTFDTTANAGGNSGNVTITGNLIGTPAYMSPERLMGKAYDGRADIYSVGVILYQMLTGQQPFAVEDGAISSVIVKHLMETPEPMSKFNNEVPANIEKLVMKALAKDVAQRPTAHEFAEELVSGFNSANLLSVK